MPEPAPLPQDGADRRYLTFRLAERLYALPAEEVSEVIRMPAVARVPQAPASLLGLANLRGSVLPVASLGGLLGAAQSLTDAARAIVLDGPALVAVAVDAVEAMVSVDPGQLQVQQAALSAEPGERLRGAFQPQPDGPVAKVLDVQGLLAGAFTSRARPARAAGPAAAGTLDLAEAADEGEKLVAFEVAGQTYALALGAVREVVPAPASLAVVPRAEQVVLGVTAYRDTLLPLLSLRGLLGFPMAAVDEDQKVVVVAVAGVLVGLVADRMQAIVNAEASRIEPTPPMLAARTGGESRISAIYRAEEGRLVSILAPDQLFREDVMQRLGGPADAGHEPAAAPATDAAALQIVVFRLGDDEFALPISAVDEVARAPEQVTRLPRAPSFLEGVINLRGEVLPVVDQRRRFDMPPAAVDGAARRLIVVRTERHRAGLLVDAVSEVLTCDAAQVEPAPDLTGEANRLVQGVVNLEAAGRLVLLLDPAELLTRAERGLLDAFAAETEPSAP